MQPVRANFFGILIKRGNESYHYESSDIYDQGVTGFSGDYQYYGYLTSTGAWIIQRNQISTGQWRYAAGQTSYSANWAVKGGLSYDYYDAIFS